MKNWVTAHASANFEAYPGFVPELAGRTVRCSLLCGVSGQRVRVRLSERMGHRDIEYGRVMLASGDACVELLFGGRRDVVCPAGGEVCSDPAELPVEAGQQVMLWLYTAGGCGSMTCGRIDSRHSAPGDYCGDDFSPEPFDSQDGSIGEPMCGYAGLDVEADCSAACAIAAFGDSITAMELWTAPLRRRIAERSPETALLNLGIGGGRLLRDTSFPQHPGVQFFGRSGVSRYEWDCAPLSGVDLVIVALGINDIFGPGESPEWNAPLSELPTLEELRQGYRRLAALCREQGRACAVCTITPCGGCPTYAEPVEGLRREINEWLRGCGEFDMVIDFDAALRDGSGSFMRPEYDSGDHIHPSTVGGERMAESIDLDALLTLAGRSAAEKGLRITTERLLLRELRQTDYDALAAILMDEETMYAYEGAFTAEETQEWLDRQLGRYREHGFGLWAVCLADGGEMIGQCGLSMQSWNGRELLEVGYLFNRRFWHRGYAVEAARACMEYAFDVLGAPSVCSIIRDTNEASQNVARRNGMALAERWTKHYRGVDMPHVLYTVGREAWQKKQGR